MSIFKDCDIRGIYELEFNETDAFLIGRAIADCNRGKVLVVGGDVRISTPVLKEKLISGLLQSGAVVWDIGMVPTPAFYYAIKKLNADGGIQVTASHNPAQYNGFKLMFGEMPIAPEDIYRIEAAVKEGDFLEKEGVLKRAVIEDAYAEDILSRTQGCHKKIVLDCCNGAMSEIAPKVMRKLGYEVVPLYCEFDGRFPNRDPNPAVYSNLTDLCEKVKECGADFGAAFDGDGDRVVFVDDLGRVVTSEQSFVLFIYKYLNREASSVVYDQKSSSIVKSAILKMGGIPRMERSGHAFIKRNFLKNHSALAGEISGHFFFRELGYDDGLYATAVMGEILNGSEKKFSDLVNEIPRTIITPDIRFFCPYDHQDAVLLKIREFGKDYEISELDGVRVQFQDGWLLVRKSVTEEGMTIRIEADNLDAMSRIKSQLLKLIPECAGKI